MLDMSPQATRFNATEGFPTPVSRNRPRHPATGSRLLNAIRQFGIVLCCLLLLAGCQSTGSNGLTVQVQRVISGQTIDVLNSAQQPASLERVRLIGIEAPDLKQQPWGEAAKNYLEQIISKSMGQQIVLQPVFLEPDLQEKDTSGRWLAYVWYEGVLLNEKLVKQGYVLAAPRAPNHKYDARIARAQEYARIMGYGIWNPDQAMHLTPAEFRRQNP
ncbi:MAG TPA: thermonuclease family protein [Chroococcales cyanobacterium]